MKRVVSRMFRYQAYRRTSPRLGPSTPAKEAVWLGGQYVPGFFMGPDVLYLYEGEQVFTFQRNAMQTGTADALMTQNLVDDEIAYTYKQYAKGEAINPFEDWLQTLPSDDDLEQSLRKELRKLHDEQYH